MTRFIVMDKSASMPSRCLGKYRRIAVVETDLPEGQQPAMIYKRAVGVVRIVTTWENLHVGKTDRCIYRKALVDAHDMAAKLNAEKGD